MIPYFRQKVNGGGVNYCKSLQKAAFYPRTSPRKDVRKLKNDTTELISTPLPVGMTRQNTCCFTGHRNITASRILTTVELLDECVRKLYAEGYEYFVCGGALGFDMLAEAAVARMINEGYPIKLILALPCVNQTEKWRTDAEGIENIREYQRLKGYATSIRYISESLEPDSMKKRNAYMVSLSSTCIAYYSGAVRSGTGQTYRMAQKENLRIINLLDVIKTAEEQANI